MSIARVHCATADLLERPSPSRPPPARSSPARPAGAATPARPTASEFPRTPGSAGGSRVLSRPPSREVPPSAGASPALHLSRGVGSTRIPRSNPFESDGSKGGEGEEDGGSLRGALDAAAPRPPAARSGLSPAAEREITRLLDRGRSLSQVARSFRVAPFGLSEAAIAAAAHSLAESDPVLKRRWAQLRSPAAPSSAPSARRAAPAAPAAAPESPESLPSSPERTPPPSSGRAVTSFSRRSGATPARDGAGGGGAASGSARGSAAAPAGQHADDRGEWPRGDGALLHYMDEEFDQHRSNPQPNGRENGQTPSPPGGGGSDAGGAGDMAWGSALTRMRALVDADTGARRSPGQKAAHADALDVGGVAGHAGEVDAGGEPLPEQGEGPALLM